MIGECEIEKEVGKQTHRQRDLINKQADIGRVHSQEVHTLPETLNLRADDVDRLPGPPAASFRISDHQQMPYYESGLESEEK